jgi:hypothetical protein
LLSAQFNHRWRSWGGAADIARGIDDPAVSSAGLREKLSAVIHRRRCAEASRASLFRRGRRGTEGFSIGREPHFVACFAKIQISHRADKTDERAGFSKQIIPGRPMAESAVGLVNQFVMLA